MLGELLSGDVPGLRPELFRVTAMLMLLTWGSIVATWAPAGYPDVRPARRRLAGLARAIALALSLADPAPWAGAGGPVLRGSLAVDALARGAGIRSLVGGIATLIVVGPRARDGRAGPLEFPVLVLLAILGRLLVVRASDLITLYLALELQALSLYALAARRRGSARSTEAGLKYFILGALASGILLLGAALLYLDLGTTDYAARRALTAAGEISPGVRAGAFAVITARAFKLALAPLHAWSPDVIEGAPGPSARLLAGVAKLAPALALARLCAGPLQGARAAGGWALRVAFSTASLGVALLGALRQRRIKRFIAYSGIGHGGFLVRGLAAGTLEGLQASVLYACVYLVGAIALWAALLGRGRADGSRPRYMSDLGGLSQVNPPLARAMTACRFSRAGIPPRAGFGAKIRVRGAAVEASLWPLALAGALASAGGAWYYLRWVKVRYFEGRGPAALGTPVRGQGASLVLGLGAGSLLLALAEPTMPLAAAHRRALARCA